MTSKNETELIKETKEIFKNDLQVFQYLNKYSRFQHDKGRREAWRETIDRAVKFMRSVVDKKNIKTKESVIRCDDAFWLDIRDNLFLAKATTSMRLLQMAGPAAERCNVSIYNCAFAGMSDLEYFPEILYILLQGTGSGFSVENQFIDDIPVIKKTKIKKKHTNDPENYPIDTMIVQDSTEGWCDALKEGMRVWFAGGDIKFDYSIVRKAGSPLKTKGGRASGPDPLRELLTFTRQKILQCQGDRLSDLDVHDINCMIGKIVIAGGVRRAAMISLSDLDSHHMANAKDGQFWIQTPHRNMSNNSIAYTSKPSAIRFMDEWIKLAKSGTGERGIFNRSSIMKQIPTRRKRLNRWRTLGTNPCGEIFLRSSGQFCNLTIAIIRPEDNMETIKEKIVAATKIGIIQALMVDFKYLRPIWKKNCEEERLLGVDLLGAQDNKIFQYDNDNLDENLKDLRKVAIDTADEWSKIFGINMPAAVTCIKPGGNSSVLYNTGNSITGWYCKYATRYVRVSSIDPMAQFLIDAKVPHYPEYDDPDPGNPRTWVFGFPLKAPAGAIIANKLVDDHVDGRKMEATTTAIQQLELWKSFKENWTEHNPSVTIYIGDDEWIKVGNWVYENWDTVCGLSFLPRDGGVYKLAPITPMTEKEYNKFEKNFPVIDWSQFYRYETEDMTTLSKEFACVGDKCAI